MTKKIRETFSFETLYDENKVKVTILIVWIEERMMVSS